MIFRVTNLFNYLINIIFTPHFWGVKIIVYVTIFNYAAYKNNKWTPTSGISKKFDQVFLSKSWVEKNIPEFNDDQEYDIEIAPDIIELKKNEKFRDDDDNIIEIEVRGVREFDKCYFKVKDIINGFSMPNLEIVLLNKNRGYKRDIDYKYFNIEKLIIDYKNKNKKTNKNKLKTVLFLTYDGLLRVLYVSRSGSAKNFRKWASETLFTIHLGKQDQKHKLVSKILEVSPETVKAVFNKSSTTLPHP